MSVHASSINHSDLGLRRGELKLVSFWRLPMIPGFDVAGEVVECGPAVTAFTPGDKVYALTGIGAGGLAEFVCVEQDKLALTPQSLSLTESAAVPLAGLTALQALRGKADIHRRRGKKVLINGASGGVGSFAIQIAKYYGCQVTAVAGPGKLDFVRQLGAEQVIDYHREDFTKLNQQWDVVFDAAGKKEFSEVRPILSGGGVMVSVRASPKGVLATAATALSNGPKFEFLMTKERGMDLAFLSRLIDQGALQPAIDRTFSLEESAAAHQYAESKEAKGKIVISVNHSI